MEVELGSDRHNLHSHVSPNATPWMERHRSGTLCPVHIEVHYGKRNLDVAKSCVLEKEEGAIQLTAEHRAPEGLATVSPRLPDVR